ncbi:MAG: cytochrome C oxidase subunit IV family protein [Candidatus Neomarinimicrobiota bacterium]|nr:cytochrome C oxidase subunit IV family protein [Candidatus Neomarinimicrobiota bacterium]
MSEEHHITPLKTYIIVAMTLFFLTAVTVWASYIDLGSFNIVLALLIAGTKSAIVATFFMHLLWDDKKNATIFVGSLMFLAIFIVITLTDTAFRGAVNPEVKDPINKRAAFYNSLPLTDDHGYPLDKEKNDHEGDKDHH